MTFGMNEEDYELDKYEKANLRASIEFRITNNLKNGDRDNIIDKVWSAGDEKDVFEMLRDWGFEVDEYVDFRISEHKSLLL